MHLKGSLTYKKGDITKVKPTDGNITIVHCCNDLGVMGAGVAKALKAKWPEVFERYRAWKFNNPYPNIPFGLGEIQIFKVWGVAPENKIFVCNLIGQKGLKSKTNPIPVDYEALRRGLKRLCNNLLAYQVDYDPITLEKTDVCRNTVIMPKLGCNRGGGDWNMVEQIVKEELVDKGVNVVVYDL